MPCFFVLAGVAQKKSATKREKRIDFMLIKVCVISTKIRRTFLSCSISSAITKKMRGNTKEDSGCKEMRHEMDKICGKDKVLLGKVFSGQKYLFFRDEQTVRRHSLSTELSQSSSQYT